MEDRCKFFDSTTYSGYGIEKRENLKANSPGSSESSTGSRTSFFLQPSEFNPLKIKNKQQPVPLFVAEPAEIPIFSIPECLYWQKDSNYKVVSLPPFFNST